MLLLLLRQGRPVWIPEGAPARKTRSACVVAASAA